MVKTCLIIICPPRRKNIIRNFISIYHKFILSKPANIGSRLCDFLINTKSLTVNMMFFIIYLTNPFSLKTSGIKKRCLKCCNITLCSFFISSHYNLPVIYLCRFKRKSFVNYIYHSFVRNFHTVPHICIILL